MIHYEGSGVTLHHGDCLDVLRTLPDSSVDSVVTDPPYGLEFMGKDWDAPWKASSVGRGARVATERAAEMTETGKGHSTSGGPYLAARVDSVRVAGLPFQQWCELWAAECLRVLKPGGHLLAFGGTRTWHRLACAVEDAGFEVRDSLAWLYGSGFPKSLDVSKAIDKAAGAEREVVGRYQPPNGTTWNLANDEARATIGPVGHSDRAASLDVTAPATDAAREWAGWGTALKPAFEPVVVARKPLGAGTVAANVLAHGTGALNIDACRVSMSDEDAATIERTCRPNTRGAHDPRPDAPLPDVRVVNVNPGGRWPANVVLDEDMAGVLDEQSGTLTSGSGGASRFFYVAKAPKRERPFYFRPSCNCETIKPWTGQSPLRDIEGSRSDDGRSWSTSSYGSSTTGAQSPQGTTSTTATATSSTTTSATSNSSPSSNTSASTPAANSETASGGSPAPSAANSSPSTSSTGTSAPKDGPSTVGAAPATSGEWSETSVCGKCGAPAKREAHATVKPLALMRWLVRLVTPPGGTVLEPFAGSGTTVEACIVEGFRCIAIEKGEEYLPLILARIARHAEPLPEAPELVRQADPQAAIVEQVRTATLFEFDGEAS